MRTASPLSRLLWAGSAGLLLFTGCQRFEPLVVVNSTDQPIRIRVSDSKPREVLGESFLRCAAFGLTLRMAPEGDDNWYELLPDPAPSADLQTCEVQFELPAHHQAAVYWNGPCSDYEKWLKKYPAMPSAPGFLRIEGAQGTIELRGWQVAQHFKRRGNRCVFIYQ
jgi:hypothetical protein